MKKPKKMSDSQIAKIKDLYTTGMNPYQIAKTMEIPPGVARYHINREKLMKVKSLPTAKTSELPAAYNDTFKDKEIKRLTRLNESLIKVISEQLH